jgi:pilus assembly protein CpaB
VKGKLIPMVGLAVVFGGLSIFVADRFVKSQTVAPAPVAEAAALPVPAVETRKLLVASAALKYGMEITPESVQEVDWPANALPQGSFASIAELTAGGKRLVLSPIEPNEPILLSKLSGKDGRASLSNLLESGKRAVSIRVDDITGVAGFVTPGDRVDVLLTRQKNAAPVQTPSGSEEVTAATPVSELASEVILQNVKVLTTDQSADQSSVQAAVARSVTVEVSTDDAQKVALAQQLGTLYLLLRSAGDAAAANDATFTSSSLDKQQAKPVAASAAPSILSLENEGPKYKSLVVTRGHIEETFSVIDEQGNQIKAPAGANN